ncbi:MAG: FtsX-like permease family protein [Spirochaetaceae bacterium]|jgi:ABC-type lipoprotein release transport system permease subunit|nr:FtsX-like permease family protein [Spirochaetaceae bacterium]
MKFPTLAVLAFKYLVRYRRRYFFLFIALSMGFSIVSLLTAVKDSMDTNVYKSAQAHYAGDIVAVGYDNSMGDLNYLSADAQAGLYQAVEEAGIGETHIVERTIFGSNGVLYFNGGAVRLKYVVGVDWDNEASYFDSLNYRERSIIPAIPAKNPSASPEGDVIYLSAPVASQLNARTGDSLILEVNTRWGQKNTGVFIVGGIVEDSTIFGYYKVYIDRLVLNRLLLLDDGDCSIAGIFVNDRWGVEKKRALLQKALQHRLQTGPIVHDRKELDVAQLVPFKGLKVFLLTIPVYLSEVADLLGAMNIIAYFLYAMMLIIMMVSALVTYRLILHERRRELGTMRAIGFYGADIRSILLLETLGLILASLAAGVVLVLLFQWLVTFIPFTWFPSFEIFLRNGKLRTLYLPRTVAVNVLAVFVSLFLAASVPVYRSSREPLPNMLNGGR